MPWPAIAPPGGMLPSPTCGRPDSVACPAAEGAASATAPRLGRRTSPAPNHPHRAVRPSSYLSRPSWSAFASRISVSRRTPGSASGPGLLLDERDRNANGSNLQSGRIARHVCLRPVETFSVAALTDHIAMIDHDVALGSAVLGLPVSDHPGVAAPVHICPPMLESHRVRTSSLARFRY